MRVRILNENINYSPKPSIDEMLKYDLWEFHEAVFMLTSWPNYIVKSFCNVKENISRTFFYEAAPSPESNADLDWQFNPRTIDADFINVYESLRVAINIGKLDAMITNLGIGANYGKWEIKNNQSKFTGMWSSELLVPNDVISWAIEKGVYIPEELQNSIGIRLINEKFNWKKVKIKIIGQFLKKYYPGKRDAFYSKHEWMKICVDKPQWEKSDVCIDPKDKYRVVLNALGELREPKANSKQGNRSNIEVENEPYNPRAIAEIVILEASQNRYNIPLLRVAMETAANLLLGKFLEENKTVDHSKNGLNNFLGEFMKNEVIALYTENAPPMIISFIYQFSRNAVEGFFCSD